MKASGSFGNLVQGVSQQVPQDRREGQIGEMVNMIPDPVNGLSRRHGSRWVAERDTELSVAAFSAMQIDTDSWRTFEYNNGGKDYVVMYRSASKPVGSPLQPVIVYNRTDSVFLPVQRNVIDTVLDTFESGGCSAVTAIGKYVFAAGNTVIPTVTTTDVWGAASNQDKAVVWIRGGGYSRTFKVTAVKVDNTVINFEYTTPKSAYSGVLDTTTVPQLVADPAGGTDTRTEGAFIQLISGVYKHTLTWAKWTPTTLTVKRGTTAMTNVSPAAPANATEFSWAAGAADVVFHSSSLGATDITVGYTSVKTLINPNYTQIVTALTNEYNSAVTKHIGDAAEAIQPQAIAEKLKLSAIAVGLASATRQDSTVILDGVKSVTVQDGGDGSLIRGVANEVASADQVSNLHIVGKVVKVRARGSEEAYYLKATAKDPSITSGYTEVSWVEGAGIVYNITNAFILCTVVGGVFYMASSSSGLSSLLPGEVGIPTFVPSSVGDVSTSPKPFFIGRKISYLGVFQDRLLVGSGGVIRSSRIGDYLNFFRTSVLTAPANDAFEMLSQGSEDDELRYSVLYDRDLVIFGAKRQYAVSGRAPLSPSNANMPVMSNHEGAGDIPPIAAGGVIFYSKQGEGSPSVHEIRPGQVAESPESYPVSSQVTTYFKGTAIEMVTVAKPSMLFLRATGSRDTLYPFSYLDTSQGRRQDAWGTWKFSPNLGIVVGMAGVPDGLMLFSLRVAQDSVWCVADLCPVNAGLSRYPYLDSLRPWSVVDAEEGAVTKESTGDFYAAYDYSVEHTFNGAKLENYSALINSKTTNGLWVGAGQEAWFTPSNPVVRDRRDKPILTGRLTVTKLGVFFTDSSGFATTLTTRVGAVTTVFNGFVVGAGVPTIGKIPLITGTYSVPIGKETREYTLTVAARSWYPLTVTGIEWVGQFFNNTQRLG